MSRSSESKFQVHLSSTKAMFQYMTMNKIGAPQGKKVQRMSSLTAVIQQKAAEEPISTKLASS